MLYQPTSDRLLVLADLSAGSDNQAAPDTEPVPSPTGDTSDVTCAEIEDWLAAVHTDASAVFELVGMIMIMQIEEDPEFATRARQAAEAFVLSADALDDVDVPAAAEDLDQDLADAYRAYGTALASMADATEQGDQEAIDEAGQAVFDAEPALISATQAVMDLASTCGIEAED